MKYAVFFFTLAAIAAGKGWYAGPPTLYFLAWITVSFVLIGLGYAGLGPGVFGKSPTGTLPLWSKVIHLPYSLFSQLVWSFATAVNKEAAYNQVRENLLIGRRLFAHEIPDGVENFVDLTAEFEDPPKIRNATNYLCFPILDGSVPDMNRLRATLQRIQVGKTYIHCAQGHGRTGLFAMALLADRGVISSYEEGLQLLKGVRPMLDLNATQARFVKNFIAERRKG